MKIILSESKFNGIMSTIYMSRLTIIHTTLCPFNCWLTIVMDTNSWHLFWPIWDILQEILNLFNFLSSFIKRNKIWFHHGFNNACLFREFQWCSYSTRCEDISTCGFQTSMKIPKCNKKSIFNLPIHSLILKKNLIFMKYFFKKQYY